MLLSEAFEHYRQMVLVSQSQKDIRTEIGRWKIHIAPSLANVPLEEIRNFKIMQLKTSLEAKKLSPQSVYHCLSLVRRVLNRAVEWEFYPGPVPKFRMPNFDNRRMRFLTREEAQTLLDELKSRSELWHDIVLFTLQTGLRAGEIYAIRPFDVDLKKSILKVYDSKNGTTRIVHLNNTALQIVQKYKVNSMDKMPLFHEKHKLPEKSYKIFRMAINKCGFNSGITDRRERVCFHTLRHTFASWLIQGGVPLIVVSKMLGHKTLKMTMRYAHLAPNQERQALQSLPNFAV